MIDMYDDQIFTVGFLLASASVGMRPSDPVVHTYVRHDNVGTLVVTLRQWSPNDTDYITARLRVLKDEKVVHQCDLAFRGDRAMPGMPSDPTLLDPVPQGEDELSRTRDLMEAMLKGCRDIASGL